MSACSGMDPKLALKPCIVLQKIPFPLIIKEKADAEAVQNDLNDTLCDRVRCHYCTDTFSSITARDRHESHHKSRRFYQCMQCEKSYTRAEHLRRHMPNHTGVKDFQCMQCDKSYTRAEHLRRHMPSHTGIKDFQCDSCKKRFAFQSNLVQHQRTHTNERPYKCRECDMAFRQINHLRQHSWQHKFRHLPTGHARKLHPPVFACYVCDKGLTTNRSLKEHIRSAHTGEKPYKCTECDEAFISSKRYLYHKQTCHEDPRYDCPVCGRRFAALWTMKKHTLLHTKSSDYVCSECGKNFHQAIDLKYHLQRHGEVQACHVCCKILPNPAQLRLHVKCHLLPKGKIRLKKLFDCGECGIQFTRRKRVIKHFMAVHTNAGKCESAAKTETEASWNGNSPFIDEKGKKKTTKKTSKK